MNRYYDEFDIIKVVRKLRFVDRLQEILLKDKEFLSKLMEIDKNSYQLLEILLNLKEIVLKSKTQNQNCSVEN